jgi:hypothetical protein
MTYDDFKSQIATTLERAGTPLTWTEIRTSASLPQAFPNNQWVHRMEKDIGLVRRRESSGVIHWLLKDSTLDLGETTTTQTANASRPRARGKQGLVE